MAWPATSKASLDHPDYARRDLSVGAGRHARPGRAPPTLRPPTPGCTRKSLGMTETCGPHTSTGHEGARRPAENCAGTFGRTVPGVELRIVDPDDQRPLPDGQEGEVVVPRLLADARF